MSDARRLIVASGLLQGILPRRRRSPLLRRRSPRRSPLPRRRPPRRSPSPRRRPDGCSVRRSDKPRFTVRRRSSDRQDDRSKGPTMASEESFFGRMAGVMRRVSAVWSGTLMIVLFFRFSLVGFELLAIQYPHFVVFLHVLRIDDDGQKAQKYYFIPEIFFLPCPFIYTEAHHPSPFTSGSSGFSCMFHALCSCLPFHDSPCPCFPPPCFFFFMWGRPSSRRSSSSMPSSRPGLVTPPHPHLATTDRRLHQGRSGSSPPLFAMWLGQGQSLTKLLLQG